MDGRPPGSSVHGISQARILEWVAISSSRESSWPRDGTQVSCISWIGRWILYHCTTWEACYRQIYQWNRTQSPRNYGPFNLGDKPTRLWSINLWQQRQDSTMEKDNLFNKDCWETGQLHVKKRDEILPHIICRNKPKMVYRSKCKNWNHKTRRREHRQNTAYCNDIFLDLSSKAKEI